MSHAGHGGGGGGASTGDAPSYFYMQQMYWAVVGSAIGVATVGNVLNKIVAAQRLVDSSPTPSKPKSLFFSIYATITAMMREVSNYPLAPIIIGRAEFHLPPLGPTMLMLANLIVVMVLCSYKMNMLDEWSWESVGYRTGFVAFAQLPLVILLSNKTNIIGLLIGSSYERLNWFHRWVARTMWLTATIHMGFWFRSWARYDYITVKLTTDPITQRGFAAWCILTFIVLVSVAPVRKLSYEIFVLVHVLTFVGFLVAVWYHAQDEVREWVWIPIGLLVFDRLARYALVLCSNLSIFHPRRNATTAQRLWAHEATFTPLPGNVTRITVPNPVISWKPGQHVLLSCHGLVPLQSHPLTIASIPGDKKLEFLVRAQKGGTKKFFSYASKNHDLLGGRCTSSGNVKLVGVEGPYGRIRPLRQFDSLVLLAGGMGATFTMPLMRDLVEGWKSECLVKAPQRGSFLSSPNRSVTKRIRFIWVIRSRSLLSWFSEHLDAALQDIDACQQRNPTFKGELEISIYVTCDEEMASTSKSEPQLPSPQSVKLQITNPALLKSELAREEILEKNIETISITSASTTDESGPQTGRNECQPDGGCCCTREVTDENSSFPPCNCSGPSFSPQTPLSEREQTITQEKSTLTSNPTPPQKPSPTTTTTATTQELTSHPLPKSVLDPRVRILSGRPDSRGIIRKVLEVAEGESGVVVCGPRGLNSDVRGSIVSLSDERAVHKGTGAQGIYLHVESFEF
ncbi:metalloreductase [Blastomyces dermatitidis ER-3]|uniref:ferric-chelate reductase (NADPH) n=1 Tax=Ajellomyces dermatitidis (strain ER-3 / ATCC MYA-2586) TaxID=559297 RepID=A0ABP2F4S0_AJEDR|nr:metalloreductase [Blastomyces dermatitidis ER-3]EEQ91698.2 metalloreductase [Blastomyces dermatitidis ER-3]